MGIRENLWTECGKMTWNQRLMHIAVFAFFIILCMGGGGIMGAITANDFGNDSDWYTILKKPDWNPPPAVFGPVWALLYLLMGVAAFFVWRETGFCKRVSSFSMKRGFLFSVSGTHKFVT